MTKPTIHLNGSPAQALIDAYTVAADALRAAASALEGCAPNGRDYYPQGSGVIHQAVSEHRARANAIEFVLADILELRDHITG